MPHPEYTLPRETAAILARNAGAAKGLARWYTSNNPGETVAALRHACASALTNGHDLEPQEREALALVLADLEALH